ncbi:MAG: hypothetical protein Q4G05_01810 [Clostridia bacterium]|nr:hypothetical protein [Clostridia bacterium]
MSPEQIFGNKIKILDANFFSPISEDSTAGQLRQYIAKGYNTFRYVAIAVLLIMLVYIGIRILIDSTGGEKAKYKERLKQWFLAMCLVFSLHYIMVFSVYLCQQLTELFVSDGQTMSVELGGETYKTSIMGAARLLAQKGDDQSRLGYSVVFVAIAWYTLKFLFKYLKRIVVLAFLTVIAPLVAITYPMESKTKSLNRWFKEYFKNIIIQPVDMMAYYILVVLAFDLVKVNFVYPIVALAFISHAEDIIRKIFGIESADGQSGAFGKGLVTGAAATALANRFSKSKDGGNSKNKKAEDKSNRNHQAGKPGMTESEDFGRLQGISGDSDDSSARGDESSEDEGGKNKPPKIEKPNGDGTGGSTQTENLQGGNTGNDNTEVKEKGDGTPPPIRLNDNEDEEAGKGEESSGRIKGAVSKVGNSKAGRFVRNTGAKVGGVAAAAGAAVAGSKLGKGMAKGARTISGATSGMGRGIAKASRTISKSATKLANSKGGRFIGAAGKVGGKAIRVASGAGLGAAAGIGTAIATGGNLKAGAAMAVAGAKVGYKTADKVINAPSAVYKKGQVAKDKIQDTINRNNPEALKASRQARENERAKKEFLKDPEEQKRFKEEFGAKNSRERMQEATEYMDHGVSDSKLIVKAMKDKNHTKEEKLLLAKMATMVEDKKDVKEVIPRVLKQSGVSSEKDIEKVQNVVRKWKGYK